MRKKKILHGGRFRKISIFRFSILRKFFDQKINFFFGFQLTVKPYRRALADSNSFEISSIRGLSLEIFTKRYDLLWKPRTLGDGVGPWSKMPSKHYENPVKNFLSPNRLLIVKFGVTRHAESIEGKISVIQNFRFSILRKFSVRIKFFFGFQLTVKPYRRAHADSNSFEISSIRGLSLEIFTKRYDLLWKPRTLGDGVGPWSKMPSKHYENPVKIFLSPNRILIVKYGVTRHAESIEGKISLNKRPHMQSRRKIFRIFLSF